VEIGGPLFSFTEGEIKVTYKERDLPVREKMKRGEIRENLSLRKKV